MTTERNAEICRIYADDKATIRALAQQFGISSQRIRQIVIAGGVWKRSDRRPEFLGVDLSQRTKEELKTVADQKHTSMSALASSAIKAMLRGELDVNKKTAEELLTDGFMESMLRDMKFALDRYSDEYTRTAAERRFMREQILARLAER